jgi:NTP pyrophosphatase (non-canonical NTP hydrolase)
VTHGRRGVPDWCVPGARAHYHPIIGEAHDGKVYAVLDVGHVGNGRPVAWLVGKSGCVAIEALSPALESEAAPAGNGYDGAALLGALMECSAIALELAPGDGLIGATPEQHVDAVRSAFAELRAAKARGWKDQLLSELHAKLPSVRPLVLWFAQQIEAKLRENDDKKPGWHTETVPFLFNRLTEEVGELVLEITPEPWDKTAAIREAADVAGLAMMIADHMREGGPSAERGRESITPPSRTVTVSAAEWQGLQERIGELEQAAALLRSAFGLGEHPRGKHYLVPKYHSVETSEAIAKWLEAEAEAGRQP